jgi:hypothetical protein
MAALEDWAALRISEGEIDVNGTKGKAYAVWPADAPKGQSPRGSLVLARLRAWVRTAPVIFVLAVLSVAAPLAAVAADPASTQLRYPVLRQFQRFFDAALQQKHLTGNWGACATSLRARG